MQILNDCVAANEACAAACLEESDLTDMAHCIELDRDCADICALAARLLQRDSELAHSYLAVCEEACRTCAQECAKHDHDHCKACAEACERCAEVCHAHHGDVALK
ncbi:MAG: four-helix bundle copper-binding protein [Marivirga sp.]|nr:four-helix bundle copper-binding protein [Marivirga sp.]